MGDITTDYADIKRIREHCEQLYAKFNNLDKINYLKDKPPRSFKKKQGACIALYLLKTLTI